MASSSIAEPSLRTTRPSSERALLAIAAIALLMQAALVPLMPVNWDEFRFLADVHELARGDLSASVQTFHSHLFLWLTYLPLDEIGQIIIGRTVMLALECMTAALIYRCAREFGDATGAAFALAVYLTLTFVVRHGASFRFDPPSTFLLMAAVTLVLTAPRRVALAIAGAAVALAAMITIKSVFYVPTLVALAWYRWRTAGDRRRYFEGLVVGALSGAVTLAALYLYHDLSLAPGAAAAQDIVAGSVDKTIGQSRVLPRADALIRSVTESPLNWVVILVGISAAAGQMQRAKSPADRAKAAALMSMALPLLTLAFYRNAFPYYFSFMLAPVCVVCAAAAPVVARYVRLELAALPMLVFAAVNAASQPFAILANQRSVVSAVHSTFAPGTPYIDRCSMIASSPKHGIFMSTWGMEVYRDAGRPIYRDVLLKERPAYIIANSSAIETALTGNGVDPRMLEADAAVLRGNFIHHWGPIWVVGKSLRAGAGPRRFEILVAGAYTVEGRTPVQIDGRSYRAGDVINLTAGVHVASELASETKLRWGRHLAVPSAPPPSGPLFGDL